MADSVKKYCRFNLFAQFRFAEGAGKTYCQTMSYDSFRARLEKQFLKRNEELLLMGKAPFPEKLHPYMPGNDVCLALESSPSHLIQVGEREISGDSYRLVANSYGTSGAIELKPPYTSIARPVAISAPNESSYTFFRIVPGLYNPQADPNLVSIAVSPDGSLKIPEGATSAKEVKGGIGNDFGKTQVTNLKLDEVPLYGHYLFSPQEDEPMSVYALRLGGEKDWYVDYQTIEDNGSDRISNEGLLALATFRISVVDRSRFLLEQAFRCSKGVRIEQVKDHSYVLTNPQSSPNTLGCKRTQLVRNPGTGQLMERQTPSGVAKNPNHLVAHLNRHYFQHSPEALENIKSTNKGTVNIRVFNKTNRVMEMFWIDFEGKPSSRGKVKPGKSFETPTAAGNFWLVCDELGARLGLFELRSSDREIKIYIEPPSNYNIPIDAYPMLSRRIRLVRIKNVGSGLYLCVGDRKTNTSILQQNDDGDKSLYWQCFLNDHPDRFFLISQYSGKALTVYDAGHALQFWGWDASAEFAQVSVEKLGLHDTGLQFSCEAVSTNSREVYLRNFADSTFERMHAHVPGVKVAPNPQVPHFDDQPKVEFGYLYVHGQTQEEWTSQDLDQHARDAGLPIQGWWHPVDNMSDAKRFQFEIEGVPTFCFPHADKI